MPIKKVAMVSWIVFNFVFVAQTCNTGFGNIGLGNVGFFNVGYHNTGFANVGANNIGILNILATRTIGATNLLTNNKASVFNIGIGSGK